jgi:hypothetical protein
VPCVSRQNGKDWGNFPSILANFKRNGSGAKLFMKKGFPYMKKYANLYLYFKKMLLMFYEIYSFLRLKCPRFFSKVGVKSLRPNVGLWCELQHQQ